MTSASDILNGSFGVLARRPASVAVWAAIQAAMGLGSLLLVLRPMGDAMQAMIPTMGSTDGDPAAAMAMMQSVSGIQGISLLLSFAGVFVGAVLLCGAFRVVLRPEEPAFASLRLGMDEVRVFAMMVVLYVGGAIAGFILALIVMLLSFVLGFATNSVPAVSVIVIAALWIATICAVLYVVVRLSMLFPLTFIRREFVIDEAWKVTRGRFWTLFLPYLVIFVIALVLSIVVTIPLFWSFFSSLPVPPAGNDPAAAQAYMAEFMTSMFGQPFGIMGVIVIVTALVQAVTTALYGGAMAAAAHGFLADDRRLPEIFE